METLELTVTLKGLILFILLWFAITAWDEVIDRALFSLLDLNEESIEGWLLIAFIDTVLVLFIFYALGVPIGVVRTLNLNLK